MQRRLPADYNIRSDNVHFVDVPTGTVHQHHVYEFLHYLIQRGGFLRVIDIGCGSAEKLKGLSDKVEITCVDSAPMREFVAENIPRAKFIECDLDHEFPDLGQSLDSAIIVCADVVEHLRRPEFLLKELARISKYCAYVLISTPDRVRARGLMDVGPPENTAHTMEWTVDEFARFLHDCGFPKNFPIGYTFNNNVAMSKNTILAVAGKEATYLQPDRLKSVAAIINVYNEADILEHVVRYLNDQGVHVHIVDNWSTDGSYEIATTLVDQGACSNVVRFPVEPSTDYDWLGLLLRLRHNL
jgi:SAM-dependent methyltransferase